MSSYSFYFELFSSFGRGRLGLGHVGLSMG